MKEYSVKFQRTSEVVLLIGFGLLNCSAEDIFFEAEEALKIFSFFLDDLSVFYINDALSMLGDVPVMSDNDNRVSLSVDLAEKTDDFLTRFV